MVQRWSNVGQTADAIRGTISEFIAGERRSGDYHGMDSALESKILLGASDQLIGLMRQNSVTGAFLILEGKKGPIRRRWGSCRKPRFIFVTWTQPPTSRTIQTCS